MIDMKLFLELMGAPEYTNRLSEDEMPAFLDNLVIDEKGIKAERVEDHVFQLLDEGEQEELALHEENARLSFPCSLAEFRSWVTKNGYDVSSNIDLTSYTESLKAVAKLKAKRQPVQIFVEEISRQDIKPWGEFESLVWLYKLQIALDDDKHRTELERVQGKWSDLSKYQDRITQLNYLLLQVHNAIEQPHEFEPGQPSKSITRRESQYLVIKEAINELGFNIMSIPTPGKKQIKKKCLSDFPQLFTEDGFLGAWKDMSKKGKLCIANKESFTKKKNSLL